MTQQERPVFASRAEQARAAVGNLAAAVETSRTRYTGPGWRYSIEVRGDDVRVEVRANAGPRVRYGSTVVPLSLAAEQSAEDAMHESGAIRQGYLDKIITDTAEALG